MKKSYLLQTALCFCLIFFLCVQPVAAGTLHSIEGEFYINGSTTPVTSNITMENTDTLKIKFAGLTTPNREFGIFPSSETATADMGIINYAWQFQAGYLNLDSDNNYILGGTSDDNSSVYLFGAIMGDANAYLAPGEYYMIITATNGDKYKTQNFTVTDSSPVATPVTWTPGSTLTASNLTANATNVTYTLKLYPNQNITIGHHCKITLRIPGIRFNDIAVNLPNKETEGVSDYGIGNGYYSLYLGEWGVTAGNEPCFSAEDRIITAEEGITITIGGITNGADGDSPDVSIDAIDTGILPASGAPQIYHVDQTPLNTLHFGAGQGIQDSSAMVFSRNAQGAILLGSPAPIYLYTNLPRTANLNATAELHYTDESSTAKIEEYTLTPTEGNLNLFRNDGELPTDIASLDKIVLTLKDGTATVETKNIPLIDETIANDLALTFSNIDTETESEKRVVIYDRNDKVVYSHTLSNDEITNGLHITTLPNGDFYIALKASLGSHINYLLAEEDAIFDDTHRTSAKTLAATGDLTTITPVLRGGCPVTHYIIQWFSDSAGNNLIFTGKNYVLLPGNDVYFRLIPTESDANEYDPAAITKAAAADPAPTVDPVKKTFTAVTGKLVRGAWYQGEAETSYPVSNQLATATFGTDHPKNYSVYTDENGNFRFDSAKALPAGAELTIAGPAYVTKEVTVPDATQGQIYIDMGTITMGQAGDRVKFKAYRQYTSTEGPDARTYYSPVTTATLICGTTEIPGYVKDDYFYITDTSDITGGIGSSGTLTLYGDHCSGTGTVTLNDNHFGEAWGSGENHAIAMLEYGYGIFNIQNTGKNACYCLIYDKDGKLSYTDTDDSIYNTGRKFTYYGPQLPAGSYTFAFLDAEQYDLLGGESFETLAKLKATPGKYYTTTAMVIRDGWAEKGTATLPSAAVTDSPVNQDASGLSVELYKDTISNRIVIAEGNAGITATSLRLIVYSNQNGRTHGIPYINGATAASDVNFEKSSDFYRIDIPDVTKYGGYPLSVQFNHDRTDRTAINTSVYAAFGSSSTTNVNDLTLYHVADYNDIIPDISLTVPSYCRNPEVNVYGYAPAGNDVEILADGEVVAKVKASNTNGLYNAACTLPNPSEYQSYTITAQTTVDGKTVTAEEAMVTYSTDTPILKTIELTDYQHNRKLLYDEGKAYELGYYYLPSVETNYIVTFDNIVGDAAVSEVTLYVENGNDVTETAMTKQQDGSYMTACNFGEAAPGKVWVSYEAEPATPKVSAAEATLPASWDDFYSWGSDLELGISAAKETGYFDGNKTNFTESANGLAATFDLNYGTIAAPIWLTLKIDQKTEVLNAAAFDAAVNGLPQQPVYNQTSEDQGYIDIADFDSAQYGRLWENNGVFTNRAIFCFDYDDNSGQKIIYDTTVTMKEYKTVCYDEKNKTVTTFTREILDTDLADNPPTGELGDRAMELAYQWLGVAFVIDEIGKAVTDDTGSSSPNPSILKSDFSTLTVAPSENKKGPKKYTSVGDADTIRQILNDNNSPEFSQYCHEHENPKGTAFGGLDKRLAIKWGWSVVTDMGKMMLDTGKGTATGGALGAVKAMTKWWVKTLYSESEYAKERQAADKEMSADLKNLQRVLSQYEAETGHKANWNHMPQKYKKPATKKVRRVLNKALGLYYTEEVPISTARIDPSGYVYEAVESNRLEGVTATIYQNDGYDGLMLWDAAAADQANPYFTNEKGEYEWFVDPGEYTIQYSKTGYETYRTQLTDGQDTAKGGDYYWLPVPPVQLDVNIGLVSKSAPTIETVSAKKDASTGEVAIYVTFDKYLDVNPATTISNLHCTVYGPDGTLKVDSAGNLDEEPGVADPTQSYARTFKLTGEELNTLALNDAFDLRIEPTDSTGVTITSYAGIPMAATAERKGVIVNATEKVATPVITPIAGTYEVNEPITLTCTTPNTKIYYTTDGAEPGIDAMLYSEAILLTKSMTVKAVAVTATDGISDVASATFTLKEKEKNIPNIEPIAVTGVTLNKNDLTLAAGATEALVATVSPTGATDKSVTWQSSNSAVAAVDANGKVTAKAKGTAVITVTTNDGNKKATCNVTVKPTQVDVTGVSLNKAILTFTVGGSEALIATVAPADATNKSATWKSSNEKLATVDATGRITAKNATTNKTGEVTITATTADGNKTTTCKLTINWGPNPFTDVATKAFYYNGVMWAYSHDITKGTDDTLFSPEAACNRAQVVTFLWNAMGRPEPTSTVNPFTDVKEGKYYYKAVLWAAEKGITKGMSATTFEPETTVTRGQFVTFLWSANGKPEVSVANPFTDVPENKYYYKPVMWAFSAGVTSGTSDTTFGPNDSCTRGQVVSFLYRDAMNN